MRTKSATPSSLQQPPEHVALQDAAQGGEFVAAVREGLAEIERGERIPIEEVERELPSWIAK